MFGHVHQSIFDLIDFYLMQTYLLHFTKLLGGCIVTIEGCSGTDE